MKEGLVMWLDAFLTVLTPEYLLIILVGTIIGLIIGALPGLGPAFTLALFLPVTFGMEPGPALVLLGALYSSAVYGGAITAILINAPGTSGSVATSFDGYPLAQQGKGGLALGAATTASLFGGIVGFFALVTISPLIAGIALKIDPATYFMLALFGLSMVAYASHGNTVKGLMLGCFGLLLSFIGRDPINGGLRFTFGIEYLESGLPFVPAVIGLFAVSQAFILSEKSGTISRVGSNLTRVWEGVTATFKRPKNLIRSSFIGVGLGAIPGIGISTSNFISYLFEQRSSKKPESYGKGNVGGVIASESANNSTVLSELIPALTLGIPGGATAAIFLAALTLHGIQPGGEFFDRSSSLSFVVFMGMLFAQIAFFVIGLLGMKLFVQVVRIPNQILSVGIITLGIVGSYVYDYNILDVVVTLVFGVIGYIMTKNNYPLAPLILGLILGEMVESNYRRALIISNGSPSIFFQPIPLIVLIITLLVMLWPYISKIFKKGDINNDANIS
jgi:putative tricarboxylic transport membrane protein